MHRIKPMMKNPDLEKMLAESKKLWDAMTPEQQEAMIQKQRESWARQDMD